MTGIEIENLKVELTNQIRQEQIKELAKDLKVIANNHLRYWLQFAYGIPISAMWFWIDVLRKSVTTFENMEVYTPAEADKIRKYLNGYNDGKITYKELDTACGYVFEEMEGKNEQK